MFRPYEHLLKDDVKNVFFPKPNNNKNEIKQLIQQIMYCLQPAVRSDITIFDIGSDGNLPETILRSICQCKSTSSLNFQLTLFDFLFSTTKINETKNE